MYVLAHFCLKLAAPAYAWPGRLFDTKEPIASSFKTMYYNRYVPMPDFGHVLIVAILMLMIGVKFSDHNIMMLKMACEVIVEYLLDWAALLLPSFLPSFIPSFLHSFIPSLNLPHFIFFHAEHCPGPRKLSHLFRFFSLLLHFLPGVGRQVGTWVCGKPLMLVLRG